MAAPKGNRYGVDSGNFFKPKAYTPEEWGHVFLDYLKDRQDKEWQKKEPIKSGDRAGDIIDIPHCLPLTIRSFCVFANVIPDTFRNYEKAEGYEEYFLITTRMRNVIEADQIDGATVGAYNPNIIARLIGLKDRSDVTSNDTEIDNNVTVEIVRKKKGK